jgi:hypothetical protein
MQWAERGIAPAAQGRSEMERGYFAPISRHHTESFKPAEKRGAEHAIVCIHAASFP